MTEARSFSSTVCGVAQAFRSTCYEEAKLFAHGQFAFDHVEDVWFDPADSGKVMVMTSRACESLRAGPESAALELVALEHSGSASPLSGPPTRGLSPRATGVATRRTADGVDEWACVSENSSLVLRLATPPTLSPPCR